MKAKGEIKNEVSQVVLQVCKKPRAARKLYTQQENIFQFKVNYQFIQILIWVISQTAPNMQNGNY